MNILFALVPLALVLALAAVTAFRWAVRDGQFDDVDTPAIRVLLDDIAAPDVGAERVVLEPHAPTEHPSDS